MLLPIIPCASSSMEAMKTVYFLIGFVIYVRSQENDLAIHPRHPDVGLNEKQLIVKYGYPLETHTVKTEDGYILTMFRIPFGRNSTHAGRKPSVLLMPPFLASSAIWVLMGPASGLPFLLADEGYDVWLGNPRGTNWSKKHEKLKPRRNKRDFWNFSFQEIGYYDNPALIDYILNKTNEERLFYIGHSQGATTFLIMAALRPEYNEKVRFMCAFSPFTYATNSPSSILAFINTFHQEIQYIAETYDMYEVLPHSSILTLVGQLFCNDASPFQAVCASVFYFIAGYTTHLNHSMIPVITSNLPSGCSIKQFLYYAQLASSDKFPQYDHGEVENMFKYGQPTPPEYDFAKITVPVAIYYGDNDLINAAVDVQRAAAQLPNVVTEKLIRGFNHLDFAWASDVVPLLYNEVLQIMKQYQKL